MHGFWEKSPLSVQKLCKNSCNGNYETPCTNYKLQTWCKKLSEKDHRCLKRLWKRLHCLELGTVKILCELTQQNPKISPFICRCFPTTFAGRFYGCLAGRLYTPRVVDGGCLFFLVLFQQLLHQLLTSSPVKALLTLFSETLSATENPTYWLSKYNIAV